MKSIPVLIKQSVHMCVSISGYEVKVGSKTKRVIEEHRFVLVKKIEVLNRPTVDGP